MQLIAEIRDVVNEIKRNNITYAVIIYDISVQNVDIGFSDVTGDKRLGKPPAAGKNGLRECV